MADRIAGSYDSLWSRRTLQDGGSSPSRKVRRRKRGNERNGEKRFTLSLSLLSVPYCQVWESSCSGCKNKRGRDLDTRSNLMPARSAQKLPASRRAFVAAVFDITRIHRFRRRRIYPRRWSTRPTRLAFASFLVYLLFWKKKGGLEDGETRIRDESALSSRAFGPNAQSRSRLSAVSSRPRIRQPDQWVFISKLETKCRRTRRCVSFLHPRVLRLANKCNANAVILVRSLFTSDFEFFERNSKRLTGKFLIIPRWSCLCIDTIPRTVALVYYGIMGY